MQHVIGPVQIRLSGGHAILYRFQYHAELFGGGDQANKLTLSLCLGETESDGFQPKSLQRTGSRHVEMVDRMDEMCSHFKSSIPLQNC